MGVGFGDISSILRELKFSLSLAVPASPPGVTADKLPSGDVFEGFFLSLKGDSLPRPAAAVPEQGFQQSGRVELPLALNTRDFIKWQRRELVRRGGSPQRHYRLSHAI